MSDEFQQLIKEARACNICADLPLGTRPVFQVNPRAKVLVVGQAPGIRVHKSGKPFDDPSGVRLRAWMGVDENTFYDPEKIGILPMGFCYPGTGKSGDLPPRKECAPAWRAQILSMMPQVQLTLLIGQYAQVWHLDRGRRENLTETVRNWQTYAPEIIPLPHPSPRNNIWLKKNAWFEVSVLPILKQQVSSIL